MLTHETLRQASILGIDTPQLTLWDGVGEVPEQVAGNLVAAVANAIVDRMGHLIDPMQVWYSYNFGFRLRVATSGTAGEGVRIRLNEIAMPCGPCALASVMLDEYAKVLGMPPEAVGRCQDRVSAFAALASMP